MVEQTSPQSIKYTGSCLCGFVNIALYGSPLKTMSCHCTDCQKSSGGPYQTNAMYASTSVSVDDPNQFVKVFIVPSGKTGSGVEKQKWFCGNCGCTLFTRPMKYNGEKSVVKTGILDTPPGFNGSRYLLHS
ncbi:Mss4-like protein [Umbelopsis sp. PMI_123]|nr:Mss4-like protein [Umbelopsis sp. PMI_123]